MNGQDFFVKIASRPPLSRLHPAMGSFFKSYLSAEKGALGMAAIRDLARRFDPAEIMHPGVLFDVDGIKGTAEPSAGAHAEPSAGAHAEPSASEPLAE